MLSRLETDLAGVMTLEDFRGTTIESMRRAIGASGALLFAFDGAASVRCIAGSLTDGAVRNYTVDLITEDPLQAQARAFPKHTFAATEFDFGRAYVRSRAYAEFYVPHQIGRIVAVRPTELGYGEAGMFGLLFWTPGLSRAFDPSLARVLKHLEVPLRSAARRIARFGELELERDALSALMSMRRGASMLWDLQQRLLWASPEARAMVDGAVCRDLARLAGAAAQKLREPPSATGAAAILGRPLPLRGARGEPLVVEFFAMQRAAGGLWLVAELARSEALDAKLALLTRAELRVLNLLGRGSSNREIAEHLSISPETVKTHVSRILGKLGVNSRSKAASLARDVTAPTSRKGETSRR